MADYFESDAPAQIGSLLVKPSDMDSAVVQRSTAKFRPQGGATYGDNSRVINFRMSSSDYVDLSTLQFQFSCTKKYHNMIPSDMYALTCLENVRVECGGVTVEDIRGVRALLPLVYAGVDADYLRSDLTNAGAYKYVPSFNGLISVNTEALQLNELAQTGAGISPYVANHVDYPHIERPSTAQTAADGIMRFCRAAPSASGAYKQEVADNVIIERINTPFGIYTATPDNYSTEPGLDLGVSGIFVPTATGKTTHKTAFNNYTGLMAGTLGKACMPNSMPIDEAQGDGSGTAKLLKAGELTRDYSLPLKLVLGLCRGTSYFPLRNVGSLSIELTLAPYASQWIHVIDGVQDYTMNCTSMNQDATSRNLNTAALKNNKEYTITNPCLQCDVVRASDAVVSRVDEMCSSADGFSIPYETYSCQQTPFAYAENVSFTYTRAFSKLKNVYISFVDQATSQCTQLSKDDSYLGSRYVSSDIMVGSTNFPVSAITSPSEAMSELSKSLGHLGTTKGSVVDRATWLGKRSGFSENQYSIAGYFPDIALAVKGTEASLRAASGLNTQAPSCAVWGHSLERVLSRAGHTYGSGISTRASGMSLTHNFKFKGWTDSDWTADPSSLLHPRFLDAHLGDGSKMLARTVFHIDGLLRIASDAVSVSV